MVLGSAVTEGRQIAWELPFDDERGQSRSRSKFEKLRERCAEQQKKKLKEGI